MSKQFVVISLALSLVLMLVPVLHAAPLTKPATLPAMGMVNSKANVRSGPSTSNKIVASASAGTSVVVLACNDDCTWYRIAKERWIAAFLVDLGRTTPTPTVQPYPYITIGKLVGDTSANANANLRSGPGTAYDVVGRATRGQALMLIGRNASGDWFQLADGTWVASFLVDGAPGNLPVVGVASTTNMAPILVPTPTPAAPTLVPVQPTPVPAAPA